YRKYRPQKFSDITNQEHIKITLQNEISMNQLAHAYIFAGPRGIGKTSLARIFSKAVNCEKRKEKEFEPCNKCPACEDIVSGKAMDIIEIDAASHTGVENVRENIIENVRFSPSRLKYKVFIIDEAHMLSTQAFNALLKTLEEPPEHVIFILATTEVHKIPATIISRCQRFDFKKIDTKEIVKRLEFITAEEGMKIDKSVLERVGRLSEGCVRDSESLLGQIMALGDKKVSQEQADLVLPHTNFEQVIELLHALCVKNQAKGIELINQLVHDGVDLKQFSSEALEFLRELLLAKVMNKNSELLIGWSADLQKIISQILENWSPKQIVDIIELLLQKQKDLKQAFPIQLPLEIFIIRAAQGAESEPLPDFSAPVRNKKEEDAPEKPAASEPAKQNPEPRRVSESKPAPEKKEPAKPGKKKSINITLEQVKDRWSEFLTRLSENNHSLPMVLRACQPMDVKENVIEIGMKYKFHQDHLMDMKNKVPIEDLLSEILSERVNIQAKVCEELAEEKMASETVNKALDQFGGKVVE
ncbi:DNA polymerase III subunit gamma/tau, partial [Patescibacteria group bacterium]|nr:DNA polymerase III subunit gamma/tau [Patescibacteria group bacterium]MBU1922459.1 DNA polymerase III subunit gamma/tau [Patescibacteria group bacterium]